MGCEFAVTMPWSLSAGGATTLAGKTMGCAPGSVPPSAPG